MRQRLGQAPFRVLVTDARRLKDDFDNGEFYYQLQGRPIRLRASSDERPDPRALEWHGGEVFCRVSVQPVRQR